MKSTRHLIAAILILAAWIIFAGVPAQNTEASPVFRSSYHQVKYRVFCVNGRIEISTMTKEQVVTYRDSKACLLDEKDTMEQAREAARRFGGVGAYCKC